MTTSEKVTYLREEIKRSLRGRIDANYWLLEVPYYTNVGDTLIWQGEIDYLKMLPFHCKGTFSFGSLRLPKIQKGDLVLFQGGGNFGDLWESPHLYRKRVMAQFPASRFIVFPQTVYWENIANMKADAAFFAKYQCTICVRDQRSYNVLRENFRNEILLVPDMAFLIDIKKWAGKPSVVERPLLLMRGDKELRPSAELDAVIQQKNIDISDWLTMSKNTPASIWQHRIYRRASMHPHKYGWVYDFYMQHFYRPAMIRSGVNLLSTHTDIYTTRLHACILSVLLGKKSITLLDNSYGKNSRFYDAWLTDCDAVHLIRE